MERDRRPRIVDKTGISSALLVAMLVIDSENATVLREDNPADTKRLGRAAMNSVRRSKDTRVGGPSRTACPFDPPIPELDIAINEPRAE